MSIPANLSDVDFVKEFASRTNSNYNSYNGQYEVTMLVDALLGLIVIPREKYFVNNPISDGEISPELLQNLRKGIVKNEKNGNECTDKSLNTIIQQIRNSICHGKIDFVGEKSNYVDDPIVIKTIKFTNDFDNGRYSRLFVIDISLNVLEQLINELCSYYTKLK